MNKSADRKRKRVSAGKVLLKLCDSLISHIPWVNGKDGKFQRQCIKEYAKAIKEAADLL